MIFDGSAKLGVDVWSGSFLPFSPVPNRFHLFIRPKFSFSFCLFSIFLNFGVRYVCYSWLFNDAMCTFVVCLLLFSKGTAWNFNNICVGKWQLCQCQCQTKPTECAHEIKFSAVYTREHFVFVVFFLLSRFQFASNYSNGSFPLSMFCVFIAEHPATLHIETSADTEEKDEKKYTSDCMHFFSCNRFICSTAKLVLTQPNDMAALTKYTYTQTHHTITHVHFNGRLADWQTSSVPPTFPKSISPST